MPRKKAVADEEPKAVEQSKSLPLVARPSVEDFLKGVKAYHQYCEEARVPPTAPGLAGSLGLTKKEMYALTQPSPDNPDWAVYARILEMAKDKREAIYLERMVSEKGVAQGCLNALKQEENGGYTDRPVDRGEKTLTVNVVGVGGESAFK